MYLTDEELVLYLKYQNPNTDWEDWEENVEFDTKFLNDDDYLEGGYNSPAISMLLCEKDDYELLTKKKEQLTYDRYKKSIAHKTFHMLTEEMSLYDLIHCVEGDFCYHEDKLHNCVHVINHVSEFYMFTPQRYPAAYAIYQKDDTYMHELVCLPKIPDFAEIVDYLMYDSGNVKKAECFYLLLDSENPCRADNFAKKTLCGVLVDMDKMRLEFFDKHHAIEMFHERFMLCTVLNIGK